MPTYEYRCCDCGHTFDVVQAMSDETLTVCPVCGGALRKVFAAPAISFKGSGFSRHRSREEVEDVLGEDAAKPAASSGGASDKKEKKKFVEACGEDRGLELGGIRFGRVRVCRVRN